MRNLIITIAFLFSFLLNGQNPGKVYYKDVADGCVKDLFYSLNDAIHEGDTTTAKELTNKLTNNCIKGKYLSKHTFKTLNKELLSTESISKPMVITIAAPWCPPCWSEIDALNALVDKYDDQMEFIVLFWDKKNKVKEMVPKYDKRIHLVASKKPYLENQENPNYGNDFKHNLGVPNSYIIDKEKKIVNFLMGAVYPNKNINQEQANKKNIARLECAIQPILN